MPFGGNHFNQSHFISYGEVMQRIKDEFGEENVCKLTELPNDTAKVGKFATFFVEKLNFSPTKSVVSRVNLDSFLQ